MKKAEKHDKKKIRYTDEPIGAEVVEDFLPPPKNLTLKKDAAKLRGSWSGRTKKANKLKPKKTKE